MVAECNAWAYRKFLSEPYAHDHIEAEEQARSKRLGCGCRTSQSHPGSSENSTGDNS